MKQVKISSEGANHRAIDLGSFDQLTEYSFWHPKFNREIKGRQFIGEILDSTGAEISFTVLQPGTQALVLHQHRKHEEIYVILKGTGLL